MNLTAAVQQTKKKAAVANGPKFREETPKKGSNKRRQSLVAMQKLVRW
jgi:hypothetical protein